MTPRSRRMRRSIRPVLPILLTGALVVGLLWAYWPAFRALEGKWAHDPRYSHGYLVPAFALFLLWHRPRSGSRARPLPMAGVAAIAIGSISRPLAAGSSFNWGGDRLLLWIDLASLLACLVGLALAVGGRAALRRSWKSLVFLPMMMPPPVRVEMALGSSLRRFAAVTAAYALETMGLPAVSEGAVIRLSDATLGVAEACNGLGMLSMFLAFATAVALVMRGPIPDRLLIVLGAIPIALAANVARIVLTAILHEAIGGRRDDTFAHDLAGWLMMPFALVAFLLVLRLLSFMHAGPDGTPRAEPPRPRRRPGAWRLPIGRRMTWSHPLGLLAATALVIAAGIVHGIRTDRWTFSAARAEAAGRLARVPMTIGDWEGRAETLDRRLVEEAELDGYLLRRYEHRRTGRTLSVMLACGRPVPLALHTPDLCYAGSGFAMTRPTSTAKVAVPLAPPRAPAAFRVADFTRPAAVGPERLRVFWSWGAAGTWAAPDHPRYEFAPFAAVYKLYVIREVARSEGEPEAEDDSCLAFARQFLPALEQALFPSGPTRLGDGPGGMPAPPSSP